MHRSRVSLTTKTVAVTLGAAAVLWFGLDRYHTEVMERRFSDYLLQQIAQTAKEDRLSFDHAFRSHNEAARFILAQADGSGYLSQATGRWRTEPAGEPLAHRSRPPWYPRASSMRIFTPIRYALLLDGEGRVREVYADGPDPVPPQLLQPGLLVTKLSHAPGIMTDVGGRPFVLSADHRRGDGGIGAGLIIATPLDSEYLYGAQRFGMEHQVALLHDGRVMASNRPEDVVPGMAVAALERDFMVAGKSFFDYGASDLAIEFASLVPRAEIRALRSSLLRDERTVRATTAGVLIGMFLGVIALVSSRLRQVTQRIDRFTRETLGGAAIESGERDELRNLMVQFRRFEGEIVRSHDAVRAAVAEQTRVQYEAEQQTRVVNALQAVTETLGVGVLSRGEPDRALNAEMARYMDEVGAGAFHRGSGELRITDATDRLRTFTLHERVVEGERLLLVRDVTAEHEAQWRLRLASEVIDATDDGVFVLDAQGNLQLANPAFLGMGRGSESGPGGAALLGRLCGDPVLADAAWEALRHDREWRGEFTVRGAHGSRRSYWLRLAAVSEETTENTHYFGILSDVTEAKQASERLQRYAEALEARNEELKRFAYVVSHDLRGPLVNIKGFAGELRMTLGEIEPLLKALADGAEPAIGERLRHALWVDVPESLGFIDAGAKRMEKLIEAILNLSRLGRRELHPEPLQLAQIFDDCVRALQFQLEERGTRIETAPLPVVICDRTALEQVFANILQNAVNYLDPARPGRIRIWATRLDQAAVVHVADNGRGIRPADREKVFTIFRRGHTDVAGEGMGLAYVQVLVQRLGGRIWFESEPDAGTTFSVLIPDRPGDETNVTESNDAAEHRSVG